MIPQWQEYNERALRRYAQYHIKRSMDRPVAKGWTRTITTVQTPIPFAVFSYFKKD